MPEYDETDQPETVSRPMPIEGDRILRMNNLPKGYPASWSRSYEWALYSKGMSVRWVQDAWGNTYCYTTWSETSPTNTNGGDND